MGWIVVTQEVDGEGRSSAMASEADALSFARDLASVGVEVVRIEAPDGTSIDSAALDEITASPHRSSKSS